MLILTKWLKSFASICVCHYLMNPGLFHLLKLILFPYTNKLNFALVAAADTDQYFTQTGTNCTVDLMCAETSWCH